MRLSGHIVGVAAGAILAASLVLTDGRAQTPPPKARPGEVEATIDVGGKRYEMVQGQIFEIDGGRGRRPVRQFYDPDYYAKHYDVEGDVIYRADRESGLRFRVLSGIAEDFEGVSSVRELIGPKRFWSGMTLLEPRAPNDREMIRHRQRVIDGKSDFMENRVEPVSELARTGKGALRLTAVPPGRGMIVSKASLDTALLHFVKGEDVWFQGWFFIKQGTPLGLVDIECSFLDQGPGIRLLLSETGVPRVELKWGDKPTYRGTTPMPREKWVKVVLHVRLAEDHSGRVELWFDDKPVIAGDGQTLPIAAAVYDRLQLGITANPPGSHAVVYVDDVQLRRSRPR